MKLLSKPEEIRSAIRSLLSAPDDRRVIAVGFVGADALSYLPDPRGITVYCWAKPGGTDPNAVEDLLRAGATVHLVVNPPVRLAINAGARFGG